MPYFLQLDKNLIYVHSHLGCEFAHTHITAADILTQTFTLESFWPRFAELIVSVEDAHIE